MSSLAAVANTSAAVVTGNTFSGEKRANPYYPKLFTPLQLPNTDIILPNRIMMGSMHTGLEGNSIPSWVLKYGLRVEGENKKLDDMALYFQERAEGGVGLMVTGGIAPNYEGWTGPFSAQLTTREEMERHKVVTDAVHSSAGSKICLQILHTGRYAYHPLAVSSSATKSPISPFRARALSVGGIERTVRDFVRCATLAQEANYDGVEIMASEGYLLSQFLSPRTNLRTDEYGGFDSLENRARLPLDILRGIRKATSDNFIIIFRLSLLDLVDGGLRWDEVVQLAQWIEEAGATILNTGIGWHEARIPTIATSVPRGAFVRPTQALKETGLISIPLVSTNRINTPDLAESILQDDASDLVSMARPLLADANFIQKSKEGKAEEINTCIACNQACLDHAFVGKTASCLVNPRAGHESTLPKPTLLPKSQRLTLNIVGAGPSGCAFALCAAQRGHKVTLYDAQPELGGQFHMAKRIPGKEEFHEVLRYFRTMLDKHKDNVTLKSNTTVTHEDIKTNTEGVDKWIIATGVKPRLLNIPGADHPNVLSYIDVLKHEAPVGKNVAIIGAGGIGFDLAEFLLYYDGYDKTATDVQPQDFWKEWGIDITNQERGGLLLNNDTHHHNHDDSHSHKLRRNITLLQRKEGKLGKNLGRTTGWIHRSTLLKSGCVDMMDNVRYDKVDQNGYLHITTKKDGSSKVLQTDTIVVCAGQIEYDELATPESNTVTIGGAYQAGELDAKRAIDMAVRLAMNIHYHNYDPNNIDTTTTTPSTRAPITAEEKLYQLLKRWV